MPSHPHIMATGWHDPCTEVEHTGSWTAGRAELLWVSEKSSLIIKKDLFKPPIWRPRTARPGAVFCLPRVRTCLHSLGHAYPAARRGKGAFESRV